MKLLAQLKSFAASKKVALASKALFASIVGVFMAADLIAGSGTAFQSVWDTEITSLLEGEPAKIIAALILLMSLYQGIMKQNYVTALGFFFACIFMSYASEIIDSFFSAGFALI